MLSFPEKIFLIIKPETGPGEIMSSMKGTMPTSMRFLMSIRLRFIPGDSRSMGISPTQKPAATKTRTFRKL